MPNPPGKTFGQMQAVVKNPSVYARLSNNNKQFVDEMQRRIDAHKSRNPNVEYEPDPRLLRLLQNIERDATGG